MRVKESVIETLIAFGRDFFRRPATIDKGRSAGRPLHVARGFILGRRWFKRLAVLIFLVGMGLLAPHSAAAQEEERPPVPPTMPEEADPAAGVRVYRQRCASCHGPLGLGDGELAADAINPPPAIGGADYLATADPQRMFDVIQNGNVTAGMPGFGDGRNSNPLTDEQIWDVVAGVYGLQAFSQPIDEARVTGRVVNGSTGQPLSAGSALLQGFPPTFEEGLSFTADLDEDGRFEFTPTNLPPDWVYRVVVTYNGLDFTGSFLSLTPFETTVETDVTVYERTADPAGVRISRLDVLVDFAPESTAQVVEVYNISNGDTAVFVGRAGDYEQGSVTLTVPEAATNVSLLRGVAGPSDFSPLEGDRVVRTADTIAPALPVPPGRGTMRLVLRYELPYDRAVEIARPLNYPADTIVAALPNSGVVLDTETTAWQSAPELAQPDPNGQAAVRVRYAHPPVAAGDTLPLDLRGFPQLVTDADGRRIPQRDAWLELWIGIGVLAVTAGAAVWTAWQWRRMPPPANERDLLLAELAALDETYAQGRLRKSVYERRRAQAKARLTALWKVDESPTAE